VGAAIVPHRQKHARIEPAGKQFPGTIRKGLFGAGDDGRASG
jgi:hypothetical protein